MYRADSIVNMAKTWFDARSVIEGSEKAVEDLSRPRLFYRFFELREVGVIELDVGREVGGGDADKVSTLKMDEIRINILTDLLGVLSDEC